MDNKTQRDLALDVRNARVRYKSGALGVLDVSFSVAPAQVIALFGPNGAGKTTTVRAVSGFSRSEASVSGTVSCLGENITGLEPHRIHKRGIAVVPERRKVFGRMTVAQNLVALGNLPPRKRRNEVLEHIFDVFPALRDCRSKPAGHLSGGQQQMLATARALMCEPKVLMIDEMTLGLHHSMHEVLFEAVNAIASSGTAVVLVDESAGLALEIADYCYLLNGGLIRDEGPTSKFRGNELIASGYVEENS